MSSSPFVVGTTSIRATTGLRREVDCRGELDGLKTSGDVVVEGDVAFVGLVETIEGGLVADGRVQATWTGECRRCLGPARGDVDVAVREIFLPSPVEGETYQLGADSVDLEPVLRETVMLELPPVALCRPDCAGLCPECGVNRNETSCDCVSEKVDPRWAALEQLQLPDES